MFMWEENKQVILDKLCEAFRMTRHFGYPEGNPLKEIRYEKYGYDEYAVPIFDDGSGEPNEYYPKGYYAVNITGDSGIAIIEDVVKQFVRKVV